jgi:hypothetical protein
MKAQNFYLALGVACAIAYAPKLLIAISSFVLIAASLIYGYVKPEEKA